MIASLDPVAVDSTTAAIVVATTADDMRKRAVVLHNDGPDTAYLGGPAVTDVNGIPLAIGETPVMTDTGNFGPGLLIRLRNG